MAIETKAQTIKVSGVTDVVVTNQAIEEGTGDYIREIRVMGADPENPVLRLFIAGETAAAVKVTAPEFDF